MKYFDYSEPDYDRWVNINSRCYNTNHPRYRHYGARGITNYWRYDYQGFLDYIRMLPGYGIGLTIDRKDNDRGYEPGNLQWSTLEEQNQNKSKHYNKEYK